MGLLGEFLESFYGSGRTPQSVWAQVRRERINTGRGGTSRRQAIGREKRPSQESKTTVDLEFWATLPDKVRVDAKRVNGGKSESTVEVTNGDERLRRTADGSIEREGERRRTQRDGDSLPIDFRRHFDRSLIRQFFASLVLEQIGACQIAGRDCVRIQAVPTPGDQIWPHWLPPEADEFEFAADLEFPSLLSITGLLAGVKCETIEVVKVTFNDVIDENVFSVEPLSGNQVRNAAPVTEPISLKAAIERVPFTVLLPKMGSDVGHPEIQYQPPRSQGTGDNLTVFYRGRGSNRFWFQLRQQLDAEMLDRLEWEEIEFSGRPFKLSEAEGEGGLSVLVFCQDGTWVEVISDHSRNDLLDIATSFEAVSG